MKAGRGPNGRGLLAGALSAPALSLLIVLAVAFLMALPDMRPAGAAATVDAILGMAATLAGLTLLVTLWGLGPALVFGLAGSWLAENVLKSDRWWAWGLAGALTAAAYVAVAFLTNGLSSQAAFIIAPWLSIQGMDRLPGDGPRPWDPGVALIIAGLLGGGFAAGALYFRVSGKGPAPKRADKRS